ncbi:PPC domain-containing DNA-binding protein [Fibrivirga algicola]|uniref:DNA-binding protein n=1 Tax=Fibrivirga algicola TaxID=2950420 RepID=A0ABX0QGI3_9BACT|nr:PPC domain-containing DNA-binding protein [Fibrivirga algicola]NID09209.1 DNA-binding protein [Fibrivirga algicola]
MRFLLLFSLVSQLFMIPDTNAQQSPAIGERSPMITYSFRLRPGQDLKEELDKVVRDQRIAAGLVLTCVGSLTDASLRLANQEKAATYLGHFEIVSLVGTLSTKGSHVHLSVSDSTGRTIGGHLMTGNKIYTTAEIVIGILPDLLYTREPDPAFGYRELVIRKQKRK